MTLFTEVEGRIALGIFYRERSQQKKISVDGLINSATCTKVKKNLMEIRITQLNLSAGKMLTKDILTDRRPINHRSEHHVTSSSYHSKHISKVDEMSSTVWLFCEVEKVLIVVLPSLRIFWRQRDEIVSMCQPSLLGKDECTSERF